ncbi:MFS general substrate transporter [Mycena venus]|uniref:MFS general substrate transporter n=1 Tax=Mycena venus TaxID=2733690 RepID=A0A8H6Z2L5_9AGAR|nr:MFS general substrate transporter [Mycena venus]
MISDKWYCVKEGYAGTAMPAPAVNQVAPPYKSPQQKYGLRSLSMDTPHVIQTRTKHLSWLLNTHPVIQAPTPNAGGDRASWTWVVPPSSDLESELAVEEERIQRYGGNDPADPPPKSPDRRASSTFTRDRQSRRFSTMTRASTSALVHPEEINWDGPDDPTNPQNWSDRRKWGITFVIVLMTVCATFASSAPSIATPFIVADFHTSREVGDLITSMFLLGYVLGPLFWGPGSELFGRRPIFIFTMSVYTILHLGLGLAKNMQTILVMRFLGGFFGVAPLVNAGGLIADIWNVEKRGTAVSLFALGVFVGPVSGPLVGAYIIEGGLVWRWVFWVMMIFSGTCTVMTIIFLPETYAPVILYKKVKALRKADPAESKHLFAAYEKQDWSIGGVLNRTLFRPFQMLFGELILFLVTIYLSVVYGVLYALFQAFPIIFRKRGLTIGQNGLVFISVGIGSALGTALNIYISRNYPKLIKTWRGFPPPEERLLGAMVGCCAFVIGIFWLGWSGQYTSVPWYVPAMSGIVLGFSVCIIFISFLAYLVETYLMYSASAFAANTIVRSLFAAAFPLFTVQFFTNLGINWAATLLGGIGLLLLPSPFLFYKYGARIRANSKFAPCLDLKIAKVIAQETEMQTVKIGSLAEGDADETGAAGQAEKVSV